MGARPEGPGEPQVEYVHHVSIPSLCSCVPDTAAATVLNAWPIQYQYHSHSPLSSITWTCHWPPPSRAIRPRSPARIREDPRALSVADDHHDVLPASQSYLLARH